MDNQMKNETYDRLREAFSLDEEFSVEKLQKEFDAEKTSSSKASEKTADNFRELRSAVKTKLIVDSSESKKAKKIAKLLNKYKTTEEKQEKKYDEINIRNELMKFGKLQPDARLNSKNYCITYLKTLMKFIIENDYTADGLINFDLDYELSPFKQLLEYLPDFINDTQRCKEIIKSIQRRIHIVVENIVNNVLNEKKIITNDIFEVFWIYAQIMLFVNMHRLKKTESDDNNKLVAFSYINYCLADAFASNNSGDKLEALEYAKDGLNILDPSIRQDAFHTLGYLAGDIDYQLAYDAYYTWINKNVVGEIERLNLYIITPAFDDENNEWRETLSSRKKEAEMHNNLAYICSEMGDSFELGSKEREEFYEIAKMEIELAIQMRKEAIQQNILDSAACSYYITYGSILQTPIREGILDDNASKQALEQYDLCLETAKIHHAISDSANAIYQSIVAIMELLYYSFHQYNTKLNPSTKSSDINFTINEWMDKDKESIDHNIKRLKELSDKYNSIMSNKGFGLYDRYSDEDELESIREKYREVQDVMQLLDRYIDDKEGPLQIVLLLILMKRNTKNIQDRLCRMEYSNKAYFTRIASIDKIIPNDPDRIIAYYTTLGTAKFLFDELYMGPDDLCPHKAEKKEQGRGKNCLTVVHAKYMNDPYEGMPLLEALSPVSKSATLFSDKSKTSLRDDIYNDTFVFLKSFTDQTDSLIMWNRYASDRSNKAIGNDSNGCCIQFDPEMFDKIIYGKPAYRDNKKGNSKHAQNGEDDHLNEKKKELTSEAKDDYHLYRTVYLAKDGSIVKQKNPGILESVIEHYNILKDILTPALGRYIDDFFSRHRDEQFIKGILSSIRQSLQFVIFLFKSDDYSDENESRLIFLRNFEQQDTISLLSTEPAKLAIIPYQQVYIKRIIFGPNVRDNEEWEPFFQYGLNKMWKKYAEETGEDSVPLCERYSIEKSSIHYHN